MRWSVAALCALFTAAGGGCDTCIYDSCGCKYGNLRWSSGGDSRLQSVHLGEGEVYEYDHRNYVYVYGAYGRDCEEDFSVRYPFRSTGVYISDSSVVEVSVQDETLRLVGMSEGAAEVRVDLEASGLYELGDHTERTNLIIDVVVDSEDDSSDPASTETSWAAPAPGGMLDPAW